MSINNNWWKYCTYTVNNTNLFIKGNYLFGNRIGKSIINAFKKGNMIYNDISENYEIEILKIKQKFYIQNLNKTNIIYVDENIQIPLKLINLKENPNIQYNIISSFNEGTILIKDNNLMPLFAGEFIIKAQVSETDNYLATESPELFIKIIKNKQNQLIITIDKPLYFRSSSIIQCIGGNTEFDETYNIKEDNINCKLKNNTIIGNNVGYCKLFVIKQGNYKYEQIEDEYVVEILPIPQYNIKLLDLNDKNTILVNPDVNIELKVTGVEENPQIIYQIVESIPKVKSSTDVISTSDNISSTDIITQEGITKSDNISTQEVVFINGNNLFALNEGICKIQAIALETHNFIETSSNIITIIVNKNNQNPLNFNYNKIIEYESKLIIDGKGGNNTGNIITYNSNSNVTINTNITNISIYLSTTTIIMLLIIISSLSSLSSLSSSSSS